MSKELLRKANELSFEASILEKNKEAFLKYLSGDTNQSEYEYCSFNWTKNTVNGGCYIHLNHEQIKQIILLINEMNEKRLNAIQKEFDEIFNKQSRPHVTAITANDRN
jgi:hypothetical protein